jgi:LasA protease
LNARPNKPVGTSADRIPFLTVRDRRILICLILWFLPALACNYPSGYNPSSEVSPSALRQTLSAQDSGSQPALETPDDRETAIIGDEQVGPQTATPGPILPTADAVQPAGGFDPNYYHYQTRSGDTLPALALRFGVNESQIISSQALSAQSYLPPGLTLTIPRVIPASPYPDVLLPDSEIVYSPSTVEFSIADYVQDASGFLATYQETLDGTGFNGAQIVQRVAQETSTNPRFLLAMLEYRSGWVRGQPPGGQDLRFPLLLNVPGYQGLYKELSLVGKLLNIGYYGWRSGNLTEVKFTDSSTVRLSPEINAGSAGIQYLFSRLLKQPAWQQVLYGQASFIHVHQEMFGDAWSRAAQIEPLLPADLQQPPLELPFKPGERWSLTAGPHLAWNTGTPLGALDFSPVTGQAICAVSRAWTTAPAPGFIIRSENNMVILDLDGDGFEQTGWVLFFYHIADQERLPSGVWINTDDLIGHPSCQGGNSTGAHVHIARKYNGEWLPADGPVPFILSGWTAHLGERAYQGSLVRGNDIVRASPGGAGTSIIIR